MLDVAGGRDDAVARVVSAQVAGQQVVGIDGRDGLGGAQDRVAVGMRGPECAGVQLEDQIVRRVLHAADLLEDHVPLEVEVALPEQRAAHQVGQHIDRDRQVGVEDVGLEGGVIAGREGVEGPAAGLELEGDLIWRAPLGALEDHVLEKVRNPHPLRRLVHARGADPDPERRGADAGQRLGEDAEPVRRHAPHEALVELLGQHRVTPWAAEPSARAACGPARPPRGA